MVNKKKKKKEVCKAVADDKNQNSKVNEPVILESLLMVGLRVTVAF